MKQQINEIKRMQQLAGLINESQLNEAREPDFVIPANDAYDLDEEAEYMASLLEDADIMTKCKAGIGEVEVYLTDKSELKKAIQVIEDEGYQIEMDSNW
jgi:hypothetical protein